MHSSPGSQHKHLFTDQGRLSLYAFGLISTLFLMMGNFLFVLAEPYFLPYAIFVLSTLFYLSLSYIVGFLGRDFDLSAHDDLVTRALGQYDLENISVDVYLPICGEPMDVIENTWRYVRALAQACPGVQVHVLDDGNSEAAKFLAEEFHFNYIRRNEGGRLKKAGNLRHAFAQTSGEFILILDADFAPRADFLIETLPYMLFDKEIAIVQTPQFFDYHPNNSWVQNGSGSIQELFYRLIQVNRETYNGAICVGTNALYRRSALEPFGGTAPIAYSEDVHTGFQLISTGWKIKYIPVVLAQGQCPETVKQFFTQQYRWALGSISLFFSKKFWTADLTVMQRVCYMTGMFYYMNTGLAVWLAAIPSIVMLIFFPDRMHWYNLLFSVPSLLYGTLFMYWWMKMPMSLDVLRCRAISYFAHLYALRDFVFDQLEEWKPTGAKTKSPRYEAFKRSFRIHAFVTLIVPAALVAWRLSQGYDLSRFGLLIFFLVINTIVIAPVFKDLRD